MASRGIRNKNPFNLVLTDTNWMGQVPGNDKVFCVFSSMNYGIRAGLKNLYNGYFRSSLNIRQLITKYAPPHENDTEAYINRIVKDSGVSEYEIPGKDKWLLIASSILRHENGTMVATEENLRDICRVFDLDFYI